MADRAERIEKNLRNALEAAKQGQEALHRQATAMFPAEEPEADSPEMWRKGEPMPAWAKQAFAKFPRTPESDK